MVSSIEQEYRWIREAEEVLRLERYPGTAQQQKEPADPRMACSPSQNAGDSEFS